MGVRGQAKAAAKQCVDPAIEVVLEDPDMKAYPVNKLRNVASRSAGVRGFLPSAAAADRSRAGSGGW